MMIVTGGTAPSGSPASTEILRTAASPSWETVLKMPWKWGATYLWGLRGVSLNNNFFVIGGDNKHKVPGKLSFGRSLLEY